MCHIAPPPCPPSADVLNKMLARGPAPHDLAGPIDFEDVVELAGTRKDREHRIVVLEPDHIVMGQVGRGFELPHQIPIPVNLLVFGRFSFNS